MCIRLWYCLAGIATSLGCVLVAYSEQKKMNSSSPQVTGTSQGLKSLRSTPPFARESMDYLLKLIAPLTNYGSLAKLL